ncbi:YtcA family lipoprotein [Aquamicrobium segne]|uniref:Uncharacterized protein YtcA n=1 Tax=Aquamicrobium segne TaxID=469547 RepID=A0ABW0H242_9HYPH
MSFFSSPSYALFGAFFPAWMLYAFIALVVTVMVRALFIRVGIDDVLPLRLVTYTALAFAFASALALIAGS